jgi:hypothetical protein
MNNLKKAPSAMLQGSPLTRKKIFKRVEKKHKMKNHQVLATLLRGRELLKACIYKDKKSSTRDREQTKHATK